MALRPDLVQRKDRKNSRNAARWNRVPPKAWCLLFSAAFLISGSACLSPGQAFELDETELQEVEELSESLANALLDFSAAVRRRDLQNLGEFFAEEADVGAIPCPAFPNRPEIQWVYESSLTLPESKTNPSDKPGVFENWTQFLSCFSEIEDARFKVVDAGFARQDHKVRGESRFKFFVVGRDQNGRRLGIHGRGHLKALKGNEEGWEIAELTFDQVENQMAPDDLFSEVSHPAGVSVSLPPYGSPGNDDFLYHGAAAADVNQNGLIDVFVTGMMGSHLYLNQGDGTFRDAAQDAGISVPSRATAPLFLDYDNDGDLDIFLASVGDQILLENRLVPEGKLYFLDNSQESGVAVPAVGFGATAGDVNRDGWPDVYVSSYNHFGRVMPNAWHQATNGTPNLLFVNQKDGTFRESAAAWEVRDSRWSYAAQFADVDNDGFQDLYVANDFGENGLYINRGDHFEERSKESGVLDPGNGMGVSFGDYNNDGILDLYVTDMSSTAGNRILNRIFPDAVRDTNVLKKLASGNSLFQGRHDGTFLDVSSQTGPFPSGWAWGGVFVDFDNDGWQDIYSPNGFISGKSMEDT